jgi:peroxiredoxin
MKHLFLLLLFPFSFSNLFADVAADAKDVQALKAGSDAPNPALTTIEGETTRLDTLRGDQPTVLVFYRGGWCPYCNRQLSALQEVMPQLKEKGWKLIALSPDAPAELIKTMDKDELGYTLVSDSKMEAAKAFGIAFQVDQPTIKKYKTYKIDLVKASGEKHQQLPVPSVFLIDATGKITYAYSNPDYKVRLSPEVLLKEVNRRP